jgi:type II secretory pathway pseudopilin PulG
MVSASVSPQARIDRPVPPRRGEEGYNLAMLIVAITILNIMAAVALPLWSYTIRREREEETIFRGLQYAEAIRVFKNRFQRDPVRLEELIEVEPRSIRRLWKDPMTESGKWSLISALEQPVPVPPGEQPGKIDEETGKPEEEPGEEPEEPENESPFGPKEGEIQVGPFKGVHSRSRKTSFLVFNGKDRYDEWHFTVDLLIGGPAPNQGGGGGGGGSTPPGGIAPPGGMPPQMSARWIGRPLPAFLQPPQGSGLPGDNQGGFGNPNEDSDGRPKKP